jgi:lipoyl(octanoyl) transferase
VPCGISDAAVTSLSAEVGRQITVSDVIPVVERQLAIALGAVSVRHAEGPALSVPAG